ncbi:MAG: glycosyltransferase [Proteobacteria bacterium]|jgi:glycosyltransferase involved in cell wall biosynthesis|nr:glycosyltransferase [Pseudomonadota bacterium]
MEFVAKVGPDGTASITYELEDVFGFDFVGEHRPNTLVQFYGPIGEHVSMGSVSVHICRMLSEKIKQISIQNYISAPWIDADLEQYAGLNTNAPIGIFLGTPDTMPKFFYEHQFTVGGFVCETDRIGTDWVDNCNRLDLVFVPSNWCKAAFRDSGVKVPIIVVPHGVEDEYRPYVEVSRPSRFVFYNTFHAASLCSRKSLEELVRTFLRAFEGQDDVVLRLRTGDSPAMDECKRKYDFGSLIEHDKLEQIPTEDFAKIYSEVHCTVHPSKGEGFGFIPFQSIACETPVIALHQTGMADYLTADNSIELKPKGRATGEMVGNSHGTYFGIDEDDLYEQLRYAYNNWPLECAKVQTAAPAFRERHQWRNVLREFSGLVENLTKADSVVKRQKLLETYKD